jgi:anti-anti-sigma factor
MVIVMPQANALKIDLVHSDNGSCVLRCWGSIVFGPEADLFRESLHDAIDRSRRCSIDLSGVSRADVRLAGALAEAVAKARRQQCQFRITAISEHVSELLSVLGLTTILPITTLIEGKGTAA